MSDNWPETTAAWARLKVSWREMMRQRRLLKAQLLAEKIEVLLIKTGDKDLATQAMYLTIQIGGRE